MKYRNEPVYGLAMICGLALLTSCSSDEVETDVVIQFAAQVNGADYTCGQTYTGIGTGADDFTVTDFRMYINDVHIKDPLTGDRYPIALAQDGVWQLDDVAMLDFEDASNGCTGTPETNDQVIGKLAKPASIDLAAAEVCFEVGLPEEKNHIDEATADSPLNASGMLWAWKIGRKYVRIDGVGDPSGVAQGFNIHLGAQGCPDGASTAPPVSACTVPNTFEVCVANFDLENSVIAVDPAFVMEGNDVTVNNGMAKGCQSFINDADCVEIMPRLGLSYDYGGVAQTSTYNAGQKLLSKQ